MRFGATGASLDVQVRVVGIHLTTEHAAEFEFFKGFAQAFNFSGHVIDGALVFFLGGHQQQVFGIGQACVHLIEGFNDLRQQGALAPQFLGVCRVVPDTRIFKLAIDFGQTLMLLIVVKDTSEWFRSALTGP